MPMTTIEVHVIQTLPPNRVNRGEDGNPKSAVMGGVPRNRISSQSMKATQRHTHRTRRTKVPHELIELRLGVDARPVIMDVLAQRYGAYDDRGRLKAMVYLADAEIDALAALIQLHLERLASLRQATVDRPKDKEAKATYQSALEGTLTTYRPGMSEDLALFGRFVAEARDEQVVAATSYAHAISTHRNNSVPDFFSAVDHVTGESAHIGTQQLAAPTYYRFASLNVDQLRRNLGDIELDSIIRRWIQGFIFAVPTHGGHGAAANTLPEHVLLIRRDGGHAVTLANAFAEPAYPTAGETLQSVSIRKLHEHLAFTQTAYENGKTLEAVVSLHPQLCQGLTPSASLDTAITAILK